LNSLNVSANVIYDELRNLRLPLLDRAIKLMEENRDDLVRFFTHDDKGTRLPALLRGVCDHMIDREKELSTELKRLEQHVHHLDAIVHMQQRYADPTQRLLEQCAMHDLIDDALSFSATGLEKSQVTIDRNYHDSRECYIEKHRVLQILVNLIANAKHAMISVPAERPRVLSIDITQDDNHTTVTIADTGKGIAAKDLPELFKFGFTTRPDGHGLGLHSCAINAQAINGQIEAHSDGPGRGARFTLTLPTRAVAGPYSAGTRL
jgi:C4-dicarboxylate-specific signal transduction histidine kinase